MKRIVSLFVFAALTALVAAPAGAQSMSNPPDQSNPSGTMDRSGDQSGTSRFAPGSSTMSGQVGGQESQSLKQYFSAAKSAYQSGNTQAASQNLRQGADILRNSAANAEGEMSRHLRDISNDLDKEAEKIQRGEQKSFNPVSEKIGDAYMKLAEFHFQEARKSYERQKDVGTTPVRDAETGRALNAAVDNLEEWSQWTGRSAKSGARASVNAIRDLAGKMISGTGRVTERTGEEIKTFGETVKHWRRDTEERPANPSPGNQY